MIANFCSIKKFLKPKPKPKKIEYRLDGTSMTNKHAYRHYIWFLIDDFSPNNTVPIPGFIGISQGFGPKAFMNPLGLFRLPFPSYPSKALGFDYV